MFILQHADIYSRNRDDFVVTVITAIIMFIIHICCVRVVTPINVTCNYDRHFKCYWHLIFRTEDFAYSVACFK
jgi:hypothetical protein